ncbi:hypothetical protein ALC53_11309, partial [Atta colombica]
YIKNSFKFVNNLISIALESNYKLVSFDIISMYTNIPIELITKKYRYMNDILLAVPNNQINEILDNFNSYNDRLRFTVEHGDDNSINFLDEIKPTNSGRYLIFIEDSYNSNHPIQHKRGIIIGQLDRILFLSHPEYHKKNIESMINILLIDYSLIIFSTINNRIKKLASRKNLYENNIVNNRKKIAYKPMNTKMEQCDVIYKISLDCDSSYVSQTKRKAKMRIKEHKANIKKLKDSLTVLHSIRLLLRGHLLRKMRFSLFSKLYLNNYYYYNYYNY